MTSSTDSVNCLLVLTGCCYLLHKKKALKKRFQQGFYSFALKIFISENKRA
jgi:hypothetical protein